LNNNRCWFYLSILILFFYSCLESGTPKVKLGIDVLRECNFNILRGKRVGLITNTTGVTSDLKSTIDVLFEESGANLVALFSPEHGLRADTEAGKEVNNFNDPKTGLPVFSLFGKTRKPTKDMLQNIDVLVYDVQDIGIRTYTYISTLGLAMEAAAENGVQFVVLDRPNPLTGIRVEGPMLEPKFKSFIGAYPIPYVYGMTVGELAKMINEEGWMECSNKCDLTVIPMSGWKRTMWWDETGLVWIPTSPHVPHSFTPLFMVMTGLLGELGTVNQGIGYTLPFELVGAPWINGNALARYLNSLELDGVQFRSTSYIPFYKDTTGLRYKGVQIHITDRNALSLERIQIAILDALIRLFPDYNIFARARADRIESFDKAVGTDKIRIALSNGSPIDEILKMQKKQYEEFLIKREKYLIYK